jgi:hypothetical protein
MKFVLKSKLLVIGLSLFLQATVSVAADEAPPEVSPNILSSASELTGNSSGALSVAIASYGRQTNSTNPFTSINVTITQVTAYSEQRGWEVVNDVEQTVDLIALATNVNAV